MLAAVSQSCVNDFDDSCNKNLLSGEIKVKFTLKTDDMGGGRSRAGIWNPSDPNVAGTSFDNAIQLNTETAKWLHVMIIDDSGNILHLNLDNGFQFNEEGNGYDMTGTLDLGDKKGKWKAGDYRVMVLANFRADDSAPLSNLSAYTTLADLKAAIDARGGDWYTADGGTIARNSAGAPKIPMWGMTTARLYLDGVNTEWFSVNLLRSVAKVKIELNQDLKEKGFTLVSATISNFNKTLYTLPSGWDTATKTAEYGKPNDAVFHPCDDNKIAGSYTITAPGNTGENDGAGSIVFYLPELTAASAEESVNISVTLRQNDTDYEFNNAMIIDNYPYGSGYTAANYPKGQYNVVRNHLYDFILDMNEGKVLYTLKCWNYYKSELGWNATEFTFLPEEGEIGNPNKGDSDALNGFVAFPSYNKGKIQNKESFADYTFTLTKPTGAVWQAFLVEDGVYYPAGGNFKFGDKVADTPSGFFFGTGNDNKNNNKAVTMGIARAKSYHIKVGTRLRSTDFNAKDPVLDETNPTIMKLTEAAEAWKTAGKVPTCYLVIRVALDGEHFTEELPINIAPSSTSGDFAPRRFAGDDSRIEIRQLFPFQVEENEGKFIIGTYSGGDYAKYTWWGYPMGHKNAPATGM